MDRTPTEVVHELIGAVSAARWDDLPDLYAEFAVVEHPYALPASSKLEGREQLRAHFAAGSGMGVNLEARNIVVHQTTDPEVVVAEFEYHGTVTETGATFVSENVFVTRVREGRIVASRDYGNHLVVAAALGRLDDVVAAMAVDARP